jgi:Holliday junction DNA helicase RuvA
VAGRAGGGAALAEATDALLTMGFSSAEAIVALKDADDGASAEVLLKGALKRLGSGR